MRCQNLKENLIVNGAITLLEGATFFGKGLTIAGAIHLNNNRVNGFQFPLAIKLSEIRVTKVGNTNLVIWKSDLESDGDFYELERSSDTKNFIKLATFATKGSSENYQFIDEYMPSGINYYRLRMNELNGSFTYSQLVLANNKLKDDFEISIYPNPISNFLYIKSTNQGTSKNTLTITDITGKNMGNITLNKNITQISTANFKRGIYFLTNVNNDNIQQFKLVKE